MELEELKKSWNALDEHLKDKELIKEEELSKLLGHTGKGIHAIANLNIKLILISLPILILVPGGSPVAQQAEPYLYHYPSSLDSRTLLGYRHYPLPPTDPNRRNAFDRSNQPCQPHPPMDHQRASVCHLFPSVLAVLSFIYWQVWQYGIGMISFFVLLWGGGLGLILWIYRKKFLNRIHEIKKNLNELNEFR